MRYLLIGSLLTLSSCAYPVAEAPREPRIKIISQNIQFEQDGAIYHVKGRIFFTNISKVPAWDVKLQIVFMSDGEIVGIVDKTFPGQTINFDEVKEFEFTKDLFVPTTEPVDMLINSWYKGSYTTIYRR